MVKKLGIPALVVALALVVWFGMSMTGKETVAPPAPAPAPVVQVATPAAPQDATTVTAPDIADMSLGNPQSTVTLIEYASFTCPHCANFHANVFKDLKRDYIDTGKIHFIYREVYFDRYGLWAAMVARCNGGLRYFGIMDLLYSAQKDWTGSDDPAIVVENLRKIGRTAGMDDATLNACLENGDTAQAMVATYQANAQTDNVDSTPTLILNGTKHPNMSYVDLAKLLDEALAN